MKKIIFSLAALAILQTITAQTHTAASQLPDLPTSRLTNLPPSRLPDTLSSPLLPVIVTANKYEQKQNETGKVLTVISREQLERASARSLTEILNEQTGIVINGANNNPGTNQTVNIRGAAGANTLILIDGVPAYDPSGITSEFDLNYINVNQVERVEILKGAQSTLYGSDAVAGVINIITKKKANQPVGGYGSVAAGTYNTGNMAAGINGSKSGWQYNAGYTYTHSEGFSAAYDPTGTAGFRNKPYTGQGLNASVGYDAGKGFSIRAYSHVNQYKAAVAAGAFTDAWDYTINDKNLQLGTTAGYMVGTTKLVFNYQYNTVNRAYVQDSNLADPTDYQNGSYTGYAHFAELYGSFKLGKHVQLVTGADVRYNTTKQAYFSSSIYGPYSTALGDSAKTTQEGVYASAIVQTLAGFTVEFGGRVNNHSIYGFNGTYSLSPSYKINDRIKLYGTVASAYRAPSLYQLYSEYGNKALKPEQSQNYEAGIQYAARIITARVTVFKRDINNVIYFYTDPVTYASQYINQDKQNDNGLEAELQANICKAFSVSANYTYTDGNIHTASGFTGKDTALYNHYRVPRNLFNLQVNLLPTPQLYVGLHLRAVSSHEEPAYMEPPINVAGYYTLDVVGEYAFTKQLKLFANLYNVTNQQYFDIRGYNSKRFNCMAGARFAF